ncbi:hypothetical protein JL720_3684 [Aureococcus anophagefferens]|nr:hypothetical protein JL720_3684 [Aureococcus anophagefferens]
MVSRPSTSSAADASSARRCSSKSQADATRSSALDPGPASWFLEGRTWVLLVDDHSSITSITASAAMRATWRGSINWRHVSAGNRRPPLCRRRTEARREAPLAPSRAHYDPGRTAPDLIAKHAAGAMTGDYWDKLLHSHHRKRDKPARPRAPTPHRAAPPDDAPAPSISWASGVDGAAPDDDDDDDDDDMWWPEPAPRRTPRAAPPAP